jgi:quinol monooxygenase YgiN
MFMSIRRYRVDPAQRDEVVAIVDEGWADHLRNEPGFLSYHVVATADNELLSMTACQDEETLEKVIQKSGEWVGTHLSGLNVKLEDSRIGKVVSHLGS